MLFGGSFNTVSALGSTNTTSALQISGESHRPLSQQCPRPPKRSLNYPPEAEGLSKELPLPKRPLNLVACWSTCRLFGTLGPSSGPLREVGSTVRSENCCPQTATATSLSRPLPLWKWGDFTRCPQGCPATEPGLGLGALGIKALVVSLS